MKQIYKIILVFALVIVGIFATPLAISGINVVAGKESDITTDVNEMEGNQSTEENTTDNSESSEIEPSVASTETVNQELTTETEQPETETSEAESSENIETETLEAELSENIETETLEAKSSENIETETLEAESSENTETESISEVRTTKDTTEEEASTQEDTILDLDELLSGKNTKGGLYYYIQKYQYDYKIVYLNKYIEYMELQVTACEKMYKLGDTTESVLKSYRAQKSIAEADRTTAYNESAYYNVYLTKNNLDYSDYNMKEMKTVYTVDYYIENYPENDYMTMARYVTDYNNAVAEIGAKQVQIDALKSELEVTKVLYQRGEISKLELTEKEVALAQAQYELEAYYVSMNIAYYNLSMLCGE